MDLSQTIEEEIDKGFEEEMLNETEIKNDAEANRLLGIYKKNKESKAELTARAKEVIDDYKYKVDLWLQHQLDVLENSNERIMNMLTAYYTSDPQVAAGEKDKIKFPNGTIGIYTLQRDGYSFDDEKALMAFIQETRKKHPMAFSGLIKMEPKLDKTALKSKIKLTTVTEATDGGDVTREKLTVDGIEIPYVVHVAKETGVGIR